MAQTPNAACVTFCTWIQANTWLQLSGSQLNLIAIIKAAGIAVTPVTDTQWKNFLTTTSWRYQTYKQSVELTV